MPTNLKIIAIIPARYASTRFPGKPLAIINGKSIIQYVFKAASKASLINRVIVATDDERIFKKVEEFGGEAWMTSSNHISGTDRISEVAKKIDADIIVNVQGDEPLIEPEVIDEAVKPLMNNSEIFMATLKTKIITNEELKDPNVVKVVTDRDDFALYFSRFPIPYVRDTASQLPLTHYKHIGLYVYRKDFLIKFSELSPTPLEETEKLEQLRALEHGYKIKVIKTDYDSIGVDTPEDLERVKEILKKRTKP
ncbi:MAG: 3-deoxy-manno-octulosonate cytidylyltransferase [Nitrospinota bacterium]